jgi:stringent starvation protein B
MRALYEWILDNNCTPYVLVDAGGVGVQVPQQYVKDGQIVLNISPTAVADLLISKDNLQFSGRFGGVPMDILVPIPSVLGIYARENGQGMIFEMEENLDPEPDPGSGKTAGGNGKPGLRIVK